ncbi:MAG TPA: hypothetical protein VMA13_03805 [Candidatus Saccharimonadales bacterium]|nr:hypothetical protein [Candidatus Saccharimonadales bacterium]
MAIKINLLAEARAAEDLRRRDPAKRCAYGGVLLVVLFLVWYSAKLAERMMAEETLTNVQSQILQLTNEYSDVTVNLNKISETKKKLAALQQWSNSRFLQGNLLNALQKTAIVPGVQLTHLNVDQDYTSMEGTPGRGSGDHADTGRSATVAEKIDVSLNARDSGANPGDQVNKFKEALMNQPYFQAVLDKTNGIQLTYLSAPQTDPNGKPYVLFTLDCRYSDRVFSDRSYR